MKNNEELNPFKKEAETENGNRRELTSEELEQVVGGAVYVGSVSAGAVFASAPEQLTSSTPPSVDSHSDPSGKFDPSAH